MDTSAYKDQFVSEARDALEDLNTNLVELEKNQSDELINKIFRTFHTLKGNAATMGYAQLAHVAHDLEDLLDGVRNKQLSLSEEVVDILLSGMDVLGDGVDFVQDDNSEALDITDMVSRIKKVRGGDSVSQNELYSPPERLDGHWEQHDMRILLFWEGNNPLRLVKSRLAVKNLQALGSTKMVMPDLSSQEMKADQMGNYVDIVLDTNRKLDDIEKVIGKIVGIQYVVGNPSVAMSIPNQEPNKEEDKKQTTAKHLDSAIKQVQSVKVSIGQLDKLMNLVGELLIAKMRLQTLAQVDKNRQLAEQIKNIDRLMLELQDEVLEIRMIPIGFVFNKFPRMIRDLAKKEDKKINLVMEGDELELDRTILDQIGDPLVHLLRNAIDHGIESPADREKAGKEPEGTVKLVARRAENHALIEISDDGAGIDPEVVKAAAVKKGKITPEQADQMTDEQLQRLIFLPSVSTNKEVTDVSGRGVGMDVVETKIKSLGGNVKLTSEVGKGSTVTLQLPLTVAIISALLINVGNSVYGIPISLINRTVELHESMIRRVQNQNAIILDNTVIPMVDLHGKLEENKDTAPASALIVERENSQLALPIDEVIGQQQILVKGLGSYEDKENCVSGATILGDGTVALIIDVNRL